MWVLMLLGTVGFWLLVAYVVRAVVVGRRPDDSASATGADEPLRLLEERLARGEIDLEEYQRVRNVLRHPR
jgi:putative membrane protein